MNEQIIADVTNQVNYFNRLRNQNSEINNGVMAGIWALQIVYSLQLKNIRVLQEMLTQIRSDMYFIGVPKDQYAQENNFLISDIVIPSISNNQLNVYKPRDNNLTYVLFGTVREDEKTKWLKHYDLTEEQNLKNLESAGLPLAISMPSNIPFNKKH